MAELVPCAETTRSVPAHHCRLIAQHIGQGGDPLHAVHRVCRMDGGSRYECCNHSCAAGGHAACACLQEHGAPHADLCSAGGGHRHPRRRQLAGYYGDHGRNWQHRVLLFRTEGKTVTVCGIGGKAASAAAEMDCRESGSDFALGFRWQAAALGVETTFLGRGFAAPASGDGAFQGTAQKRRDLLTMPAPCPPGWDSSAPVRLSWRAMSPRSTSRDCCCPAAAGKHIPHPSAVPSGVPPVREPDAGVSAAARITVTETGDGYEIPGVKVPTMPQK